SSSNRSHRSTDMTFTRRLIEVAALCAVATAVLAPHDATLAAEGGGALPAVAKRPAALPSGAEHKYPMLAKVRPLLFWISKDDVGGARITGRGDDNGRLRPA